MGPGVSLSLVYTDLGPGPGPQLGIPLKLLIYLKSPPQRLFVLLINNKYTFFNIENCLGATRDYASQSGKKKVNFDYYTQVH